MDDLTGVELILLKIILVAIVSRVIISSTKGSGFARPEMSSCISSSLPEEDEDTDIDSCWVSWAVSVKRDIIKDCRGVGISGTGVFSVVSAGKSETGSPSTIVERNRFGARMSIGETSEISGSETGVGSTAGLSRPPGTFACSISKGLSTIEK